MEQCYILEMSYIFLLSKNKKTLRSSRFTIRRGAGGRSMRFVPVSNGCVVLHLVFNPLNPELNPICYLLALLGAYHFLHVSGIRVKLLTFRLLMSYMYMEHPFLMFLDHTQRRSTVGRTPLDE